MLRAGVLQFPPDPRFDRFGHLVRAFSGEHIREREFVQKQEVVSLLLCESSGAVDSRRCGGIIRRSVHVLFVLLGRR